MRVFAPAAFRSNGQDYPYGWQDLPQSLADTFMVAGHVYSDEPKDELRQLVMNAARSALLDPVTGNQYALLAIGAANTLFSFKVWRAKGDGRVTQDGTTAGRTGAGPLVVNSNTINFTQDDVGKALTLHNKSATWTPYSGLITSVQSATQCTMQAGGTVAAIAAGGALLVGSDDTTPIANCVAAAKAVNGTILIEDGIYISQQKIDFGGCKVIGAGRAGGNPWSFPSSANPTSSRGSQIIKALAYQTGAFITFSGEDAQAFGIAFDACILNDRCVDVTATQIDIGNCTIARGIGAALNVSAGTFSLHGSKVYGPMKSTGSGFAIQAPGDFSMYGANVVFGASVNQPTMICDGPTDDCSIRGTHFYRAGAWTATVDQFPGAHILFRAYTGKPISGGLITENVFDTCQGNAIEIAVYNTGTANASDLIGLTISNNEFYQPQANFTDSTYSCINIDVGNTGSTVNCAASALSIMGNVGRGYKATNKRWKSFINTNVNATYGSLLGAVAIGNAIADCVAFKTDAGAVTSIATGGTNATINTGVVTNT